MELFVARNGQQTGPYEEARVRDMLARGEVAPGDLAWHSGLSGWQPLSTLFPETQQRSAPPAPLPPPAFPSAPSSPAYSGGALPAPMMMPPGGAGGYGGPGYDMLPAGQTLAGLGARLGAALLDGLLLSILYTPGWLFGAMNVDQNGNISSTGAAAFGISGLLVLLLLAVQAVLVSNSGQTIGKKIVGIRIRKLDGSLPGFVVGFLLRSVVGKMLLAFVPFYGLVDIGFIFRADHRCIHDLIASTRVVNA